MHVSFEHVPHPRIEARKKSGPPKTTDEHVGPNGRIALVLTTTDWPPSSGPAGGVPAGS